MSSGIYEILNVENGKRYIGSAKNIAFRWSLHVNSLKRGDHHSVLLQRAYNKYGCSAFRFKELILCDVKNLLFYEQRFIDAFEPEYNISKVAGSRLGVKASKETIERLKESWRIRGVTDAQKRHLKEMIESNIGRKRPPMSEDQKQKLRDANLGKKHSESSKEKLRKAMNGRYVSEETKKRMSAARSEYWKRIKSNVSC